MLLQLAAKFRNSGQTCVCANRVIVQEGKDGKILFTFLMIYLVDSILYLSACR